MNRLILALVLTLVCVSLSQCGDETRGDVINNFDCHVEIYTEAQLNAELADGNVEEGDVLAELAEPDGTVSYEVYVCNGVQASEDNDSTVANGTINVGVNEQEGE